MNRFRCTVEYRLEDGTIHHQTEILEAESGDRAMEMARRSWQGRNGAGAGDGSGGEIEEIVCEVVAAESPH